MANYIKSELFDIVEKKHFNIIFLFCVMNNMIGYDVCSLVPGCLSLFS